MRHLTDLFATIADRVAPPVCVALGPARPAARLVAALNGAEAVCYQMDLHQADKLRHLLAEEGAAAEVVAAADLWDLPPRFQTVLFPAAAQSEWDLKLDVIEQAFHVLVPGGKLVTLSEYEKDSQVAKWHKKVFGRCGETPASKLGMAFWSTREKDQPRRRHEVSFHARLGDGPPMSFVSRPGVFSYGRFDNGSRALAEVAEVNEGDHVLDLGSGVGAVGCLAGAKAGPGGRVTFVDSNLRAAALSELNAKANGLANSRVVASATLEGLGEGEFDVVLANPPYYGDSVVARLFVTGSRPLLKPGGRFYIVTKMPTAVVPLIFDAFGGCDVIENRGYTIATATAA
jgi:16S rRNA (guanine1207-N2)-methyltransferase